MVRMSLYVCAFLVSSNNLYRYVPDRPLPNSVGMSNTHARKRVLTDKQRIAARGKSKVFYARMSDELRDARRKKQNHIEQREKRG